MSENTTAVTSQRGFGEIIRQAREQQGISMGDLEALSRISLAQLTAIEEENVDALPEPVYVRAFLRSIAKVLHLDGQMLTDDYMNRYAKHAIVKPVAGPESDEVLLMNAQRSGRGRLAFVVLLVLVLAAGAAGYYYYDQQSRENAQMLQASQEAEKAQQSQALSPAQEDAQATQDTQATPSTTPSTTTPSTTTEATQPGEASQPVNAEQAHSAPAQASVSAPAQAQVASSDAALPTAQAKAYTPAEKEASTPNAASHSAQAVLQLSTGAHEAWVQVKTPQGKVLFTGIMTANTTRSIDATWGTKVTLGRADGVSATVNGRTISVGKPSKSGVVVFTLTQP